MNSKFYDRDTDDISLKPEKQSIGETPESCVRCIHSLQTQLLNVNDLKPCWDGNFLLRFLRVSKFDVKKAFDRICKYYHIKKKYPKIFDEFYPSSAPTATVARHVYASPWRANDNSAIIIHKRGLFDPSTMLFDEMLILDFLVLEHLLDNPLTQLCGVTVILDFAGYNIHNFFQDTPRRLRMAIDVFQNTFPLRYKNIHIVNAPSVFSFLYNISYPFLTRKIKSRLHFHYNTDGWDSLHSLVRPELLPEEYGGKIPKTDLIDLVNEVIHKEDYFRENIKYGFVKNKS